MRAARYHGVRDVRLEQIPEPEPGPGQIKIAVAYNGLCGSDLHEYFNAPTFIPMEPHPLTGAHAPCVLGHEFSGTVVAVGDGAGVFGPGDRGAVRPTYSCGECPACRIGAPNICKQLAFHGGSAAGGGLSEFTVVDETMAHKLPDSVSLLSGALVEPLAVAQHAVNRAAPGADDTVVVIGSGAIGIGVWLALRARGIEKVIVSEPSGQRRQAISRLGAERVVDPTSQDLQTIVDEVSGGVGAAVVFDAAGVPQAFADGLSVLAPHGILMVVSVYERGLDFNPTALLTGEHTITTSLTYSDTEFAEVIANMERGVYGADGWTDVIGLDQLTDAFELLRAGEAVKILVEI